MKHRVPKELRQNLDDSGLDWTVEGGGNHMQLRICGRLATVLPRGTRLKQTTDLRSNLNSRAQIRRIIARIKEEMKEKADD